MDDLKKTTTRTIGSGGLPDALADLVASCKCEQITIPRYILVELLEDATEVYNVQHSEGKASLIRRQSELIDIVKELLNVR